MTELLPAARLRELAQTYLSLPLGYGDAMRNMLLSSVSGHFTRYLVGGLAPGPQLQLDLNRFNQQGPLADGSIPFLQWLAAVVANTEGLKEQKVFLAAIDDISHKFSGAPRINPVALPEYKEKIIHQDDMVPHSFMARGLSVSTGVAKLRIPRFELGAQAVNGGNPIIYLGTGWLLTDSLMMTNHHVVNARNEGETAAPESDLKLQSTATDVLFDFDEESVQGTSAKVKSLEAWDEQLDYAILRLAPTGRTPLAIRPTALQQNPGGYTPVNIIQHPEGMSKRYAIRNNLVSAITDTDLRYFTDTRGGSSGSPVLDDNWQVVALHRGSTFAEGVSFQGRSTAWINLGTSIHAILKDLRDRNSPIIRELAR